MVYRDRENAGEARAQTYAMVRCRWRSIASIGVATRATLRQLPLPVSPVRGGDVDLNATLQHEPSSQRAVLLITDGSFSDIDVHEQNYLTDVARVAVLEARRASVRAYCIAVDISADNYVRRTSGRRNYCIAENPSSRPAQLQRAGARLAAN